MAESHCAHLTDRAVVGLTGADAHQFLQGLISNDVDRVTDDRAIYAALLSPQGKFLHELFVARAGDQIWLETETERRADLIRRLTMFRLRAKVEITDLTDRLQVHSVFGGVPAALIDLAPDAGAAVPFDGGVAMVDPRLAALGLRIIAPPGGASLAALDLASATPAEYDRHRLALGVPDGSHDIQVDKSLLLESNFEELNGVDFEKGCYVGQENTTRQKRRATVRKRLIRVDVDGPLPDPGTPVTRADKPVGEMRSGRDRLGIALLRLDALETTEPLHAGDAVLRPVKPDWARY